MEPFLEELRASREASLADQSFSGEFFEVKPDRGTFGRPRGLFGRSGQINQFLTEFRETLLSPITERWPFKSLEEARAFVAGERPQEPVESLGGAIGRIGGTIANLGGAFPVSAEELARDPLAISLAIPPAGAVVSGGVSGLVRELQVLKNSPQFVTKPLSNALAHFEITEKLAARLRNAPVIRGASAEADDIIVFRLFDDANPEGILKAVPDNEAGRAAFNDYAAVGRIEDITDAPTIRKGADIMEVSAELDRIQLERIALQEAKPVRPKGLVGISDQELLAVAKDMERNPFTTDWFDSLPSETIKSLRAGMYKNPSAQSITKLKSIEEGLKQELRFLQTGKEPPVRAPRGEGRKGITVREIPEEGVRLPVQEPGAPESGVQLGALGVPAKEVSPAGKGVTTQIGLDDQLRLQQARETAAVPGGAGAAAKEPAVPRVSAGAATPPQVPPPAPPVTGGPGGPLDRVRGMWREPPPIDETALAQRLKNAYRSIQEQLTDKFAGINGATARVKRIWQRENPGQVFPLELDAEAHAALIAGGPMSGIEWSLETLRRVKQIAGRQIDDVDTYLHFRHNQDILKMHPDRAIAGGLEGADDLVRGLGELETILGPEAFGRVERAGRVMADHYAALLRRKVASGLVTPKLATVLREQYPFYNPIRYIEQDLATFAGGTGGRPLSVTRNDIRFLSELGSESIRERPLLSLARATTNAEMLIRRNDAAKALVKMALRDPELKGSVTKITPSVRVAQVEGQPVFRPPKGQIRGAISFLEGGKRVNYEVPAWLENEAKHLSTIPFTSIERVGQILNAVPRAFLTSANPSFFAANFVFDSLTVMLTRGLLPHRVLAALGRNFRALVKDDPVFSQMMKAGGSVSGFSGQTPEQLIQAVNKSGNLVLHDRLSWNQLLKNPLRTIEKIGSQVELAPRRAVFEAELRRGTDVERAALAARRGTVDFQRSGVSIRMANSLFLYLNAGLQGTLLPLRAVRDGRAARYGLTGFAMAQLGIYAWNRQFPEYADVPLFDKYTKGLIMLPSRKVDDRGNPEPRYIAIILREFTAISAPLLYLLARTDETAPEAVGEFLGAMLPSINPFGQIVGGGLPVPTYLGETLTEMALNKDVFRDRDIVPVDLQGKPAEEQFDEFNSETSKRVGAFLGFSPKKLDHLMRVGLGWDIISAVDRGIAFVDPQEVDPEVEAVIARLESIQENFPPEQVATQRNLLLHELSKAQRQAVEERLRQPEPSLPFVYSMQRRFYREGGGQLFRSGRETAARGAGLSVSQTQDASNVLGDVYDELFSMQAEIDEALDTQEITPAQWRDARRAQGALYQGALLALAQVFPQAAQAQPRQEWSKFQEMVYTLAGSFADRRTRAQILVSGLRAIPVDELAPGVEDLQGYFSKRDAYIEGLSPEDQGLLRQELDASSTPTERQYTLEQDQLKPYWEAADELIAPDLEPIWEQYLALPNSVRDDFIGVHPELEDIVKEQRDRREDIRQFTHNIDVLLVKWHGASPSTPEGQAEFDRLYGDILNLEPTAPVGSIQAESPVGETTDTSPLRDQLREKILEGAGG